MKACDRFQENLVLYAYGELPKVECAELEVHLQACASCRLTLSELQHLHEAVPTQPLLEPDDAMLQSLRNVVSLKIREIERERQRGGARKWAFFSFVQPAPAFQLGFVLLLLAFGFLLGRQTGSGPADSPQPPATMLESLLTASEQIQSASSRVDPFLASVDKLTFDPATGQVEIHYNTVNDIAIKGDLGNSAVREMLRHAMLEENNPAVRLHAVKAVSAMLPQNASLDADLLEALAKLLEKEQNTGVRLQALRVLRSLPFTQEIKGMLVKLFLYDEDTALRIEAFKTFAERTSEPGDIDILRRAARDDSSGYIKYQATKLLKELEAVNPDEANFANPRDISRED